MDPTTTAPPEPKPLVSILMLTYNANKYIGEAISSVIYQTYQNWELIIIDDGSADTTPTVVAHLTDPRIHYHRHEHNRGLAVRRPESLAYARGDFVAILDSDDLWLDPKKLEEQVTYMNNHPTCAVVGTFIRLINSNGAVTGSNEYATTDDTIRRWILVRNQFAHSSVLMRKALLDQTPGYTNRGTSEDLDLYLHLGRIGTFGNISKYLTGYRQHHHGVSHNKRAIIQGVLQTIRVHRTHYPHALLAYLKMYLLWCTTFIKIF